MTEQRLKVEAEILKRIDEIRPSNPKKSDYTHGIDVGLAMAKVAIKDAPTIEERKTGTWIYGENKYGHDGWQCDQCGHWILWDYHVSMEDAERDLPKYCPSCGARMVQEGEDNECE